MLKILLLAFFKKQSASVLIVVKYATSYTFYLLQTIFIQFLASDSKLAKSVYLPQISSLSRVTDSMNYFKLLSLNFFR